MKVSGSISECNRLSKVTKTIWVSVRGSKDTVLPPSTQQSTHLMQRTPLHMLRSYSCFLSRGRPSNVNNILQNCRFPRRALLKFRQVWRQEAASVDSFTLLFMLKACTNVPSLVMGRQGHALVITLGFEPVIFLQTSLINMYSVTGNLADAHRMFEEIPRRNVVCWTALISAYVENGKPRQALELFNQTRMENVEPDLVMITVALSACADLGSLEMGQWIHGYICRKKGFKADLSLENALINMYAKCGDVKTSRWLFDRLRQKDVTTWTSMIIGHAIHGQAEAALTLFTQCKKWVIPNEVTFLGVLMACGHAGLVDQGLQYLDSMSKDYKLRPSIFHYGCMVDTFCRAGLFQEALAFMREMPIKPNAVLWRVLLAASSFQGDVQLGHYAHTRLLDLEPRQVRDSVIVANLYAAAGIWTEKSAAREQIRQRRTPGCSLIEVESGIHEFVAADKSHPQKNEIYGIIHGLVKNLSSPEDALHTPDWDIC